MCLHFHPHHSNLLALGLHDGCVLVVDVRQPNPRPLYEATAATGKHMDAVAAVRWAAGEGSGLRSLAFYSVSADGHIAHWTLAKSSLVRQVSHSVSQSYTFSSHLWLTLVVTVTTQHTSKPSQRNLRRLQIPFCPKNCVMRTLEQSWKHAPDGV